MLAIGIKSIHKIIKSLFKPFAFAGILDKRLESADRGKASG